ncbi:membrane protein [Pseudoclavibacter endophyticus]|uniref:DoxX family membrane protein n=1 Tax=Pseudoclavibacter endophyticus TaxID=1778590 RepID=A0A6H9WNU4_9MICO|nr:hypothetical protein [Pseudoclavibacter endophyticus]KAB1649768.1 hypothetical protein F8O04_05920 [Pseudoclavibacter endophyticus]GGA59886.1 membrane protein [Pseudoclavibacter endophyticus]
MATTKNGDIASPRAHPRAWLALAIVRILVGFEFLWAFIDKTFGLTFATSPENAWINGGSPTHGYLSAERALQGVFEPIAGHVVVDVLFMAGLLGVGVGLMAGIAVRLASIGGALMMLMMWLASFPIAPNPFVDYHLVEGVLMAVFAFGLPAQRLSFAGPWRRLTRGTPWLQ